MPSSTSPNSSNSPHSSSSGSPPASSSGSPPASSKSSPPASSKSSSSSKSGSSSSSSGSKGTIFISGYWPPTNIESPDGMLQQFKPLATYRGKLGEYVIQNYKKTGYRIVLIATEFPSNPQVPYIPNPAVEQNWGGGAGLWQVDYPVTSYTFWTLMKIYTPVAVMTTSRWIKDFSWRLEIGSTNLAQNLWDVTPQWNIGRPPNIGGSPSDSALPNVGHASIAGNPPDVTINSGVARNIPANVKALQVTIMNALKAQIAAADLAPDQPTKVQGDTTAVPPDIYVSAFAGYHAVWYQAWRGSVCKAGWHTHVGYKVTLPTATKAIGIQLDELIKWLNAH